VMWDEAVYSTSMEYSMGGEINPRLFLKNSANLADRSHCLPPKSRPYFQNTISRIAHEQYVLILFIRSIQHRGAERRSVCPHRPA